MVGSDPAVFRAPLTLRDGRTLALTGELADLDLLERWVGYLQERQRKGARRAEDGGRERRLTSRGHAAAVRQAG